MWSYVLLSGLFALFGFSLASDFFDIDFPEMSTLQKLGLGGVSGGFGLAAVGLSRIYIWFDSLWNGSAGWGVWIFFVGFGFYLLAMFYSWVLTKGHKLAADSVDYMRAHRKHSWHRPYRRKNTRRRK